jgi:hypothetical protein
MLSLQDPATVFGGLCIMPAHKKAVAPISTRCDGFYVSGWRQRTSSIVAEMSAGPDSSGCTTAKKPVPLQPEHSWS